MNKSLLLLSFLLILSCNKNKIVQKETQVTKKTIRQSLLLKGRIFPKNRTLVQSYIKGQILELAEHGSFVKKGDLLLLIDEENTLEEVTRVTTQIETQKIKNQIKEKELASIRFEEQQSKILKKAQLAHSLLALKEKQQALTPEELQLMNIDLEVAEISWQEAKEELQRQHDLLKKDFISKSFLEKYLRREKTASEKVKELKLRLVIKQKGITEEEKIELQAAISRSRSELERSEAAQKRRITEALYEQKVIKDKISELTYKLKNAEEKLQHSKVYAENDGIFLRRQYRDWRSGGRYKYFSIGRDVRRNTMVAEIVNDKEMVIKIVVNEADARFVSSKMKAEISFPSIPNKIFKGHVQHIGQVGRDRNELLKEGSGNAGIAAYKAEIHFDGKGQKFHSGMSSLITLSSKETKLLTIPRSAIFWEAKKAYVFKTNNQKIPIEGHICDELSFAIDSGLQEGESILLHANKRGDK